MIFLQVLSSQGDRAAQGPLGVACAGWGEISALKWSGEGLPKLHGSVPAAAQIRALAAVILTPWFWQRDGRVVFRPGYLGVNSNLPLRSV